MGAALRTAGKPYYQPTESRCTRSHQPPPAYTAAIPSQHAAAGDSVTTAEILRDNTVAELRRVTTLIKRGHRASELKLSLKSLLTFEDGIVVMADPKITPTLHETFIVANNALARWDRDRKRSLYTVKGHCFALSEYNEGSL